jgi:hypothetical protein
MNLDLIQDYYQPDHNVGPQMIFLLIPSDVKYKARHPVKTEIKFVYI